MLVVETGSGESDSESYLSVADADTLISNYNYSSDWTSLSTAEKEALLRQQTEELDYMITWDSEILNEDQALMWPRKKFEDKQGREVVGITGLIKRSLAQLVGAVADGKTEKDPVYLESQSWGDSSETYSKPIKAEDTIYSQVSLRLKRAGYGHSSASIVDIYRA